MTKMAAMSIYSKNLKKSSTPEPTDRRPLNLICSIVKASSTKIARIMALVKFGHLGFCMGKGENNAFVGNNCSLWFRIG